MKYCYENTLSHIDEAEPYFKLNPSRVIKHKVCYLLLRYGHIIYRVVLLKIVPVWYMNTSCRVILLLDITYSSLNFSAFDCRPKSGKLIISNIQPNTSPVTHKNDLTIANQQKYIFSNVRKRFKRCAFT